MQKDGKKMARTVFNTFCSALDSRGWKYQKNEDELTIRTGAKGDDLPLDLHIKIDEGRQLIYIRSPLLSIPEDKRREGASIICAINYRLIRGCFDYDERDGEVVFRLGHAYTDSIIGPELCINLLSCVCSTVDEFNDGIALYVIGALSYEGFLKKIRE